MYLEATGGHQVLSSTLPTFFETGLLLNLELTDWLNWLTSKLLGDPSYPFLSCSSTEVIDT